MAESFRRRVLNLGAAPVIGENGFTLEENQRSEFRKGFDQQLAGMKRGAIATTLEMTGDALGLESLSEYGAATRAEAEREASTLPPLAQPDVTKVDWTNFDDVTDWVGGGLGQVAPSIGLATGAGAAVALTGGGALPAMAAAAAPSFLSETGNIYADIKDETGEQAFGTSIAAGAAIAGLDTLGLYKGAQAAVPRSLIRAMIRKGISRETINRMGIQGAGGSMLRRIGEAKVIEGATEGAQGVIGDYAKGQYIEGINPWDINRRVNEMALGALGGGAVATAVNVGAEIVTTAQDRLDDRASRIARETEEFGGDPSKVQAAADTEAADQNAGVKQRLKDEATINYSRGLDDVQSALLNGELEGQLTEEELNHLSMAVELADEALNEGAADLTDNEVSFIKKIMNHPLVSQIFNRGEQKQEEINQQVRESDTSAGYDEAANTGFNEDVYDAEADYDTFGPVQLATQFETSETSYSEPIVRLEASQLAATNAGVDPSTFGDTALRAISKLREQNKDVKLVPLSEVVLTRLEEKLGRAPTQKEATQALQTEALKQYGRLQERVTENTRSTVTSLYDPANPASFVDNFVVVKETKAPSQEDLTLPEQAFNVVPVRRDANGNFSSATDTAVFKSAPRESSGVNPQTGDAAVTLNGKRVVMNFMNLINSFRNNTKLNKDQLEQPSIERLRADFSSAIAAALTNPNNKVQIDFDSINPTTIAYRYSDGREITLGQLLNKEPLWKQIDNLNEQRSKVENALKEERLTGKPPTETKGTYEVSSRGDKRFSALFAKLKDGRTIEQAWAEAKGYPDTKTAKNKPAKDPNFDYWETYLGLWRQWAKENPALLEELRRESWGKKLTDQFAKTENNQARALETILAETARTTNNTVLEADRNKRIEQLERQLQRVNQNINLLQRQQRNVDRDQAAELAEERRQELQDSEKEFQPISDQFEPEALDPQIPHAPRHNSSDRSYIAAMAAEYISRFVKAMGLSSKQSYLELDNANRLRYKKMVEHLYEGLGRAKPDRFISKETREDGTVDVITEWMIPSAVLADLSQLSGLGTPFQAISDELLNRMANNELAAAFKKRKRKKPVDILNDKDANLSTADQRINTFKEFLDSLTKQQAEEMYTKLNTTRTALVRQFNKAARNNTGLTPEQADVIRPYFDKFKKRKKSGIYKADFESVNQQEQRAIIFAEIVDALTEEQATQLIEAMNATYWRATAEENDTDKSLLVDNIRTTLKTNAGKLFQSQEKGMRDWLRENPENMRVFWESPTVQQRLQMADDFVTGLNKALGLSDLIRVKRFVSYVDAQDSTGAVGNDIYNMLDGLFTDRAEFGHFSFHDLLDNKPSIFVNPLIENPAQVISIILHEYGHALTVPLVMSQRSYSDVSTLSMDEGSSKSEVELIDAVRRYADASQAVYDLWLKEAQDTQAVIRSGAAGNIIFSRRRMPLETSDATFIAAMHGSKERLEIPFMAYSDAFKQYWMSYEEWLADRMGQEIVNDPNVNKVVHEFLDAYADMYPKTLLNLPSESETGHYETALNLMQLWLPFNRNEFANVVRENMNDRPMGDIGIDFMRAEELVEDLDANIRAEMNQLVKDTLGVTLQDIAVHWAQRESTATKPVSENEVLAKLIKLAKEDVMAGDQLIHHTMMAYAIDRLLSRRERALLGNIAESEFVQKQIRERLQGDKAALKWLDHEHDGTNVAIAYMYQFYYGDTTFKLSQPPKTLFDKIRNFLRGLLNIVPKEERAAYIMAEFEQGNRPKFRQEGYEAYSQTYFNRVMGLDADGNASVADKLVKGWRKHNLLSAAQARIRKFDNPFLNKLGQEFSRTMDESGVSRTYFEERQEMTGRFMTMLHKATKNLTVEQQKELAFVLRNFEATRKTADQQVVSAAADIILMMDDISRYVKRSGTNLGERGGKVKIRGREVNAYFPWMYDESKVMAQAPFISEVMKRPEYREHLKALYSKYMYQKRRGPTGDIADSVYTFDRFVDELAMSLIGGVVTPDIAFIEDNINFVPAMGAAKARHFWWLLEDTDAANPISDNSRKFWSDLMEQDAVAIAESYIDQAVKRAAFAKRFGTKGEKLDIIMRKAADTGATHEELKYAEHYVQAMLGSYGRNTHLRINQLINWASEKLGKGQIVPEDHIDLINPKFSKFNQVAMAYQNMRILDFAVFTSLIDPAGIAVRSGSIRNAWRSFVEGIKSTDFFGGITDDNQLRSISEMLGITEDYMNTAALEQEYGGNWMNGKAKKFNDALFKYSGLQAWTRTTRLMATSSAMQFLKFHTTTPNQYSAEYLAELGLQEGDLVAESFNEKGHVKVLTAAEQDQLRSTKKRVDGKLVNKEKAEILLDKQTLERDQRVRTAILRYTNEAILRPNAAQRPVWASDPHFALIFHLKQFLWSFVETIIKHAAHRANNGQYVPLMLLGTLYPVGMAGIDALRDWLRYGSDGAPSMQGADWTDYATRAMSRSGVLGFGDLAVGARTDMRYGGIGIENLAGPSAAQFMDLLSVPFSNNDDALLRFIDRATPLQNTTKTLENWTGI